MSTKQEKQRNYVAENNLSNEEWAVIGRYFRIEQIVYHNRRAKAGYVAMLCFIFFYFLALGAITNIFGYYTPSDTDKVVYGAISGGLFIIVALVLGEITKKEKTINRGLERDKEKIEEFLN